MVALMTAQLVLFGFVQSFASSSWTISHGRGDEKKFQTLRLLSRTQISM